MKWYQISITFGLFPRVLWLTSSQMECLCARNTGAQHIDKEQAMTWSVFSPSNVVVIRVTASIKDLPGALGDGEGIQHFLRYIRGYSSVMVKARAWKTELASNLASHLKAGEH